jgi:hypothetical protein
MNAVVQDTTAEPLIFSWDSPQGRKITIVIFLALSVVGHALCFYVFQIVYPPTVALLPPPARLTLITADSEDGRALLRWIDAEDPALAFTTQRPPEAQFPELPKAKHVPSYKATSPVLKELPSTDSTVPVPSCQSPGAVNFVRPQAASSLGTMATSVSFSKELAALGAPSMPKPDFAAASQEAPQPIRFQVAVNKLGEVRYCFPLNSSGDPALDERARMYITGCRFPENAAGRGNADSVLAWGTATIEWGNDIARPNPLPAARTGRDSR